MPTPQQADVAAYEHTPYPAVVHPMTHPDRMTVLARLAGVAAAPVTAARVLDIGCANGLNLLSLAAAYPGGRFVGFDLVPEAIERGAALARRAGLGNVALTVADLTDPGAVAGSFDYVIAHGVLSWTTPALGEALFELIARHLAPDGVAFVSFNALPGAYLRQAMRDAMLAAIDPAADAPTRLAQARAAMEAIGEERPGDDLMQQAFRARARETARIPGAVLEHDELTRHFTPRYLDDVIGQAAAHGLEWLGDTRRGQLRDGFLPDDVANDDPRGQVIAAACMKDRIDTQMFRAALFVRAEAGRRWAAELDALTSMFALSRARESEPGRFAHGGEAFQLPDQPLAAALRAITAAYPRRIPIASLGLDRDRLAALWELSDLGLLGIHATPDPFAVEAGEAPMVSPLIRAMLADGAPAVPTLDHAMLTPEGTARDMLMALDGSGRSPALAAAARAAGIEGEAALAEALASIASLGVLVP